MIDHEHQFPPEAEREVGLTGGIHFHYDDGSRAIIDVSVCTSGEHVILDCEDADEDITNIDLPPMHALYVSAAMRLAALRVIAKSAPPEDLERIAEQIDDTQREMNELAESCQMTEGDDADCGGRGRKSAPAETPGEVRHLVIDGVDVQIKDVDAPDVS